MTRIFISYRRADSRYVVDRIYDRLVSHFGPDTVFKDIDSIPLGVDFRRTLEREISRCQAVLVVIGQRWLRVTGKSGQRRLDEPNDFVRAEIEIALARKIPVIPLLVDGAAVPAEKDLPESIRPLAFRNGAPVRPDPDFHSDLDRIVRALDKLLGTSPQRPAARVTAEPQPSAKPKAEKESDDTPPPPAPRRWLVLIILWVLLTPIVLGLAFWLFGGNLSRAEVSIPGLACGLIFVLSLSYVPAWLLATIFTHTAARRPAPATNRGCSVLAVTIVVLLIGLVLLGGFLFYILA